MPAHAPSRESDKTAPSIVLIAGFGDNATMFDGLHATRLAKSYRLLPVNLPGFGAPALDHGTTLGALAAFVASTARQAGAEIIVAHSVASIVASLAVRDPLCPVTTVLSLEGNLTADDAYFSGMAADFDDPQEFRSTFLDRLGDLVPSRPEIARYRAAVEAADPLALWQLGRDARRFSAKHVPGEVLLDAGHVCYLHNPDNCPARTLAWLKSHPMKSIVLPGATHWASVDQPEMLAEAMLDALADFA